MIPDIIFVVGNSRSGTTLLGRALGRHEDIFVFHELHFVEQEWQPTLTPPVLDNDEAIQLANKLYSLQYNGYFFQNQPSSYSEDARKLVNGQPFTAPELFRAFLFRVAQRYNKSIACIHTPRNLFYLDELFALYPQSKAIHMVRDPRDVASSQKYKWKRRHLGANIPINETIRSWVNYHPISVSLLWNNSIQSAKELEALPSFKTLHFEQLITAPEQSLQELCDFLSIPFSPAMLNVEYKGSSRESDQPNSVGFNQRAIGRWKTGLSKGERWLVDTITYNQRMTYDYDYPRGPLPLVAVSLLLFIWPAKLMVAMLLNVQRFRNLPQAINKRLRL